MAEPHFGLIDGAQEPGMPRQNRYLQALHCRSNCPFDRNLCT
jgi:hypothetical protein